LVGRFVDELIQCHSHLSIECQVSAKDAVDEVLQQAGKSFDTWATVNQTFFFELEKSFPEAWQKLEQYKHKVFAPGIKKNLQRGMEEKVYRDDLNVLLTTDIRLHQLTTALQPAAFSKHRMSVSQLVGELTTFYLHGITTAKGKKLLYKYLKNRNENRPTK